MLSIKNFFSIALLLSAFCIYAQEDLSTTIKVGDTLKTGQLTNNSFEHIKVPKSNFITKKGGIPNYKSLENNKVVVTEIKTDSDGNTIIVFERSNGIKFFNVYKSLKANLSKALKSGELKI